MTAAAIADGAVGRRVLVVGSPPPGGRDLDLLVRPEEETAIARALELNGFSVLGNTWARFAGGTADVVDLIPAAEWRRGDDVFDAGVPLDGYEHLAIPAPHHDLLLAATRFLGPSGHVKEGRMRRLAAGPARVPAVWRHARAEARAWEAEVALERLNALFDGVPRRDIRGSVRALVPRLRRRGAVVALSGAGTAAQAAALAQALDRLGYEVALDRVRGRVPDARLARHLAAGRVVVFDGYELDAIVRVRLRGGRAGRLRRALFPRPVAAFHLDPGDDSPASRLYRDERDALGVLALDATRPPDELGARIAELAWRVLSQ